MSRDAFRRLALLAGATAWVVAVGLVWMFLGWPLAVAAMIAGPLLTVTLTLETQPPEPKPDGDGATREGLSRRDIVERSRRGSSTH